MPRVPRISLEGALYYVTSRGIQGQDLFKEKEDYAMYAELLNKNKGQHGFKLFSFVLLPSHVHMLVETKPQTTLSDIMHNVTTSYTKYYNKKYNRQGHLFRGRFRAVIIEKDPYLLKLTRYLHLNPKILGLSGDAHEYPYSSYLHYTGQQTPNLPAISLDEEIAEVRGYLGGRSYEDFMRDDCALENKTLHEELKRKVFLGSQEFSKTIHERIEQASSLKDSQQGSGVRPRKLRVSLVAVTLLAAVIGFILLSAQKSVKTTAQKVTAQDAERDIKVSAPAPVVRTGLDGMTWQVKFVAGTPFQAIDILTFNGGMVNSENMSLNGYPPSYYTFKTDGLRLTWETMQTSKSGVALWRGEVEGEQMKGVLSLRPKEGAPQDFSFVSLKHTKIDERK